MDESTALNFRNDVFQDTWGAKTEDRLKTAEVHEQGNAINLIFHGMPNTNPVINSKFPIVGFPSQPGGFYAMEPFLLADIPYGMVINSAILTIAFLPVYYETAPAVFQYRQAKDIKLYFNPTGNLPMGNLEDDTAVAGYQYSTGLTGFAIGVDPTTDKTTLLIPYGSITPVTSPFNPTVNGASSGAYSADVTSIIKSNISSFTPNLFSLADVNANNNYYSAVNWNLVVQGYIKNR